MTLLILTVGIIIGLVLGFVITYVIMTHRGNE